MSSGPPNFGPKPSNQNPYGENPYGSNPYGPSPYQAPGTPGPDPYAPKPASRFWMYMFFGLIGGGVALCGCCGIGSFLGLGAMGSFLGNEVATSLTGNPVIEEHIGTVTKCEWNFMDSVERADDAEDMVFDIEGSKGKGQIYGTLGDDDETLTSGTLHTEKGSFDLFP